MFSELMLFDLRRSSAELLLATDRHIEAPNWSGDGRSLIVNSDGLLYRVMLDDPRLDVIDTGFATACNNDHGLSPDGKLLAISDRSRHGESAIYTLPADGGLPEPLGVATPAYWHGWSPDGSRLAYVSDRGEGYSVFTCRTDGSGERRVTRGFAHCDGPDYSADGEWIWFNGERDGAVDLWRIRSDGADLERMTDDVDVNWFPHPCPDGSTVLYLAYPPGTEGHPFGKTVSLRLMPANGGKPRELIRLFGGQGTINVPCWAPDGRRFAFVRYAETTGRSASSASE